MPAEDRVDPTRPNKSKLSSTLLDATVLDATLLDATLLDAVAARLTRASVDALGASYELLAHYPDTGDASTQRAVDRLIDQAAEALGALTDSLNKASLELVATAVRATTAPSGESSPSGKSSPSRESSPARAAGRRRGPLV